MSDKLENALADAIEKANSGIDAATEFVMSELPEVIQQVITWYTVKGCVIASIWFALMVLFLFSAKYGISHWKSYNKSYEEGEGKAFSGAYSNIKVVSAAYEIRAIPFIASIILALISFFVVCAELIEVLKIVIAPKLWLIEYASKLAS